MLIFTNQKVEPGNEMAHFGNEFTFLVFFQKIIQSYTKEAYLNIAYVKTIIYFRVMY